jgi:4'-phosphopantetheinyl transferase
MRPLLNAPKGADVDLWPFDLCPLAGDLDLLNQFERHRAERFVFKRDRSRFIAAHAQIRRLLGGYLGVAPDLCEFEIGPNGKPALAGASTLRFNLAHSSDRAVLAVSSGAEVGVDIESPVTLEDPAAIATEVASEEEAAALRGVPPTEVPGAFLRLWTRKEATLKAFGTGLSIDPRAVNVGITGGTAHARCPVSGWRAAVCSVELEGCSAAVARVDGLGTVTVHWSSGA